MFTKILVPVDIDYPNTARSVYLKALAIAKLSNAEIKLVSVMTDFGMPIVAAYISEEIRRAAADRFKDAIETFIEKNCQPPISYTIRTGKNWQEIIRAADKWGADLIVVYHNHRREINEVFSRSCSQSVADRASCSVLRLRNIRA